LVKGFSVVLHFNETISLVENSLKDEIGLLDVNFEPIANNLITNIHLNYSLKEFFP
tara:strand:- start:696 stop:863 length:168 start_codon:yes stop_codon:yes gene_type:complete